MDRAGMRLFDKDLPNDQSRLWEILAGYGQTLLAVDQQPSSVRCGLRSPRLPAPASYTISGQISQADAKPATPDDGTAGTLVRLGRSVGDSARIGRFAL